MTKKDLIQSNLHKTKNHSLLFKTSFNSAGKKKKRLIRRRKKEIMSKNNINLTSRMLRPVVHCPTKYHNTKIKMGRGFSYNEIKFLGMGKKKTHSLGLAIDQRRKHSTFLTEININRIRTFEKVMTSSDPKELEKFFVNTKENIDKDKTVLRGYGSIKSIDESDNEQINSGLRSFLRMRELRRKKS
mmetsp:Transcript_22014/g.34513  ORF Transcript_22014/g.34513 Transcript_22014/m.34513 type:complete len:186 (-) Transcript_22014:260-817(-)